MSGTQDTNNSVYRDFHRGKKRDPRNFATMAPGMAAQDEQEDTRPEQYADLPQAKKLNPESTLSKLIANRRATDDPFSGAKADPLQVVRKKTVRGPDGTPFSY